MSTSIGFSVTVQTVVRKAKAASRLLEEEKWIPSAMSGRRVGQGSVQSKDSLTSPHLTPPFHVAIFSYLCSCFLSILSAKLDISIFLMHSLCECCHCCSDAFNNVNLSLTLTKAAALSSFFFSG